MKVPPFDKTDDDIKYFWGSFMDHTFLKISNAKRLVNTCQNYSDIISNLVEQK